MTKQEELKANIEELARQQNKTQLEIITQLQTAIALADVRKDDEEFLTQLCDLKWGYIYPRLS